MSDKVFVGQMAGGLETAPQLDPVTKVILLVDDENYYEAGTDGGRTLEVTCPYASQAMANNILASLSGYQYQPAKATDALMDPAAEFGDAITVDGVYTVIADMGLTFDQLMTSDVGAPGQEEIESEYPYLSQQTTEANRKLAETRSLISKTSEEIKMEVANEIDKLSASITIQIDNITQRVEGLDGEFTEVSTTLDGLTVTDSSGTTKIKGSSIETDSLYVSAAHITGTLSANQIDATNLHVNAANIDGELTIGQLPNSVATTSDIPQYTSELINNSGYQTESGVTTIVRGTVTTDYVNALGVSARYLQGQTVYLLDSNGSTAGTISIQLSSTYALDISSDRSLRMQSAPGYNTYLSNGRTSGTSAASVMLVSDGQLALTGNPITISSANYGYSLPSGSQETGRIFFLIE